MTRAQMEAARERVGAVLDERIGPGVGNQARGGREALIGAILRAAFGHPDGKAAKR